MFEVAGGILLAAFVIFIGLPLLLVGFAALLESKAHYWLIGGAILLWLASAAP